MTLNPFVLNNNGTVPYDQSLRSKLYCMGYSYDPSKAKVKVVGFTSWRNPELCYAATTRKMKQRDNPSDIIVMLGNADRQEPYHVILTDRTGKVVFDNNRGTYLEGQYVPNDGYYVQKTGKKLYDFVYSVSVKDFLDNTQEDAMNTEVKSATSLQVAAVDSKVMEDVIKALYLMMYYVYEEKPKLSNGLKKRAGEWENSLKKFLATFRIPNDDFLILLRAARTGAKYTAKISETVPVVGNMLLKAKEKFEKDNTIPHKELAQLYVFGRYFRTNSESAGVKLIKAASNLRDPELLALFASDSTEALPESQVNQKALYSKMMQLSKKFMGKGTIQLSKEERAAFKKKAPDALKQFTKAQRMFLDVPKNFLRAEVRRSGKDFIDYGKFLELLKKNKIAHAFPPTFIGNIGQDGEYYTKGGLLIDGKPMSGIVMNPKYDANEDKGYVMTGRAPGSKDSTKFYTQRHNLETRTAKKFQVMETVEKGLGESRGDERGQGWINHLLHGTGRDQIRAAELELIYLLGARPGTAGNKTIDRETGKEISTYGITTMLVKHVIPHGKGFMLAYDGKKATALNFQVNPINKVNKKVIEILKQQIEGKGPNDLVWTDQKGKKIPSQDVLNYAKKVTRNADTKLYTFRYMAANVIARKELSKHNFQKGKVSQGQAEAFFTKALTKIGEYLQHHTGNKVTGATATRAYVDPFLMHKFFLDLGLRVPKNIPNVSSDKKALLKGKKK